MDATYPDVVVIGAQKSGTSTFYRNLVKVSAINFAKQKAANVLIEENERSEIYKRYGQFFSQKLFPKVEVSPRYSQKHLFADVAKKLVSINPSIRIIYLVRDPIDRIVSHLNHNALRDRLRGSTSDELIQNGDYVKTSSYYYQIKPYFDLLPIEQIGVWTFEEMILDPNKFQIDIFNFLQVSAKPIEFTPFNVTKDRYLIKYYDVIHDWIKIPSVVKLYHYFWLIMNIKPPKVILDNNTKLLLAKQLQHDIDEFISTFNVKGELWRTYQSLVKPLTNSF